MAIIVELEGKFNNGELQKGRFQEVCQSSGLRANSLGVLADPKLRGISSCIHMDWMHCLLQDGVLTTEIYLFISKCESLKLTSYAEIENFLKEGWAYPGEKRSKMRNLHRLFGAVNENSSHNAERFKCTASELLGLRPS